MIGTHSLGLHISPHCTQISYVCCWHILFCRLESLHENTIVEITQLVVELV